MPNLENGIDSLTNFKRQTAKCLLRLHQTGLPMVLTVNGKPEVVVQDAAAYRRLVDLAARADRETAVDAIREGLADAEAGRVKPARKVLKTLAKRYGIPTADE